MSKQDYYETLEVAKGATVEEIKKSYRRLAMKYHPDRNQGNAEAEAKFKEINEAYEILKDDQKRAAYDRYGHAAFEQGGGANPFDFNFGSGFGDIFSEVFSDFMGGGRRSNRLLPEATARICAMTWRFRWKMPLTDWKRKFLFRRKRSATNVTGSEPRMARNRRFVRPVAAADAFIVSTGL